MRFAHVVSASDCINSAVDQLAEHAGLDFMQLDYRRLPEGLEDSSRLRQYADGFVKQLQTLHRWLYLDTQLRLITNAGGGDPLGCIETLSDYLRNHDHGELPITLIRGDNVLASLEALVAAGLQLRAIDTGEPIDLPSLSLIAAHVELGAGPLATALDEGSRVVVAGNYAAAAPGVASAVSTFGWSWSDIDRIALVGAATSSSPVVLEIESDGQIKTVPQIEFGSPVADELHSPGTAAEPATQTRLEDWLLRLVCQEGYLVEAFVAGTEGRCEPLIDQIKGIAGHNHITVSELTPSDMSSTVFLHVLATSKVRGQCETFLSKLLNLVASASEHRLRLVGRQPMVGPRLRIRYCPVLRDQITVSVDTRPADEWR
ncbi:MAG: acyclic terpene utilization AtuA family protein [Planctomycetota bacterium]